MSTGGKPRVGEELERIEDALVDSLLDAAGQDVRQEIADAGGDPDAMIAKVEAVITSAQGDIARRRLERARSELATWRSKGGGASAVEREAARARLERLQSGGGEPDESILMAARKGEGLSESDLQGLIEDMAELERLERDNSED